MHAVHARLIRADHNSALDHTVTSAAIHGVAAAQLAGLSAPAAQTYAALPPPPSCHATSGTQVMSLLFLPNVVTMQQSLSPAAKVHTARVSYCRFTGVTHAVLARRAPPCHAHADGGHAPM